MHSSKCKALSSSWARSSRPPSCRTSLLPRSWARRSHSGPSQRAHSSKLRKRFFGRRVTLPLDSWATSSLGMWGGSGVSWRHLVGTNAGLIRRAVVSFGGIEKSGLGRKGGRGIEEYITSSLSRLVACEGQSAIKDRRRNSHE
ncbi:hypothetical protein BD311DRAFT_69755 [Dichomitus squalens]|uniref:Uncharacterized protein n=1 Tax=Dichomitus squalens TaxID=114155 RepID=A0A4Q9MCN3_9APHY|nr:hypothetical protein BD311DRAFT_69755 [Dichomitus squalens]